MTDPASGTSRMISKIKMSTLPRVQQFAPFMQPGAATDPVSPPAPVIPVMSAGPAQPPPAGPTSVSGPPSALDEAVAMQTFDEVMQSLTPPADPGVLPQAVPMAVQQTTSQLNPPVVYGGTTAKETFDRATADQGASELGGLQQVEYEQSPELSPEISDYLQKVEDQVAEQPQEIVISPQGDSQLQAVVMPQPVVVLPITPEVEQQGQQKSTSWSVRWLVEWSRKLMKMLSGHIIYRQT